MQELASFLGLCHALTLLVVDGEALVDVEELGPRQLAGRDVGVRVLALPGELVEVAVSKLPHPFQAGAAVLGHRVGG